MGAKTDDWYSDAVESLGITKPNCSKNHSPKFKEDLIWCHKRVQKSKKKSYRHNGNTIDTNFFYFFMQRAIT